MANRRYHFERHWIIVCDRALLSMLYYLLIKQSEPLPAMYEIVNSFLKCKYLNQSFHALEAALGLLKNISISSLKETSLTVISKK